MKGLDLTVRYNDDEKTVSIAQRRGQFYTGWKHYNKITTAGDIGTAVKDYVIGIEAEESEDK